MVRSHRIFAPAAVALLGLALVSSAATDGSTTAATAIADAYKRGDGVTWHKLVVQQLAADRALSPTALDVAIGGYVTVAASRGPEALLSLILSDQAELADRSAAGTSLALGNLASIGALKVVKSPLHPNALAPVVQPGSPVVHHLPIGVVQQLMTAQVGTATFDPDGLLDDALCSPQGQADFTARYGAELGKALADLCGGSSAGALDGGTGMGSLDGLSSFDCVGQHEPTRAEKLQDQLLACMDSILGGQTNPFADGGGPGSLFDWVFPLRPTRVTDRLVDPTTGEVQSQTDWDGPPDEAGSEPIVTTKFNEDGTRQETYYNEQGEVALVLEFNEQGQMTKGVAPTPEGGTEQVDINDDNSYTVTERDKEGNKIREQSYDQNGKPVPAPAQADPGGEWGTTTAECRAFAIMALEDRFDASAEARGVRPEVVNPNPEAPVDPGPGEDCFDLAVAQVVADTVGCADTLVHCALGEVLTAKCACSTPRVGVVADRGCALAMMCVDGSAPKEEGGQCTCASDEGFFDAKAGGGPKPPPIDAPGWSD